MNWETVLTQLERGERRAAVRSANGQWQTETEVKIAILEAFKAGQLTEFAGGYVDKHNLATRGFAAEDGIRLVPGGSAVRRGSYVAKGVIIMPPAYINIGAFVDEGSMVDSHALVGSCAQIGKNVHLSAAVQIGGVLEPIGANPVIVEDHAFIGAGAIIVEGIIVREGAVIAPGVVLSKGVSVYDAVHQQVRERGAEIPSNAVVVPGSRPLTSDWAQQLGLSVQCPVIIKYRDTKSNASLELEEALR